MFIRNETEKRFITHFLITDTLNLNAEISFKILREITTGLYIKKTLRFIFSKGMKNAVLKRKK